MTANGFLDPNQLGGVRQRSTTDAGVYLTHIICAGWLRQCHTSVIAFDIAQFFPSLNHDFLSICLKKAGLNTNVVGFFNSYHSNRSTIYTLNNFSSPAFNTNVGVGQGSALSPILSAIYLAPVIKIFNKRIKNLKENILTDILSFMDDSLLISQEKSYSLSSFFLLCSYNIISKTLINAGLVMEHSKTELFHFTRARHPPNPSIDLSSVGGPVISPKPIWRYLGFYFNCRLNFNYHTHFYVTKCLSTLSAMKMLGNSSRGFLPIQRRLLYRTCILSIALYRFQLWFFKGTSIIKNITELKKMQQRAALWITGAFQTFSSEGIEAIASLIPITLHLRKLNGRHHLCYASIPPSHAINSLLDSQHAKNQMPHKTATSKLTAKQQANLKSPIKDVNERLNSIRNCFNPLHPLFTPGSRIVDHFSSRISFHSPSSSSDEDLNQHLQNLNLAFRSSQVNHNSAAVITDGGIKKSHVVTAAVHIWADNSVIKQLQVHSLNITSIKAELMAVCTGLIPAIEIDNIHDITVITDSITAARKILESKVDPLQNMLIPLATAVKTFLSKDGRNKICFWYCPSRAEWPRHKLVDDQVKASSCTPTFPSKESHLLSYSGNMIIM